MRLFLSCLYIIALFGYTAHAQTIIRGTVTERDTQKELSGINVTIQEQGNAALVGYTLTDEKGTYRLEYKGTRDSIIVTASGFNISKQTKTIANRNQTVDFVSFNEAIAINEVKVMAKNIQQVGDTIKYSVSGYIDQNDHTIGDVIKKLPGVEVKDNGTIYYNDRPINRYYIEDLDLLGPRYGIANNNIQARDVSEVQILENHQPIKALQDTEFSEDAALNLKLKDGAKSALIAHSLLGAGAGKDSAILWTGELSTMYFSKKTQNISTYKGNNTGNNVSKDQGLMFDRVVQSTGTQEWLRVQSPSVPTISQNRYLKNKVNAFSFNNLWGLKNNYQLTANINYINDRQDKSSYSRNDYRLPVDSLLTIEERLGSRTHIHQGSADIRLNANTKQFYLDNTLTLSGAWDWESGNALTTKDSIYQKLKKPSYSLSNSFRLIKNHQKTALTFYSANSYTATSNTLQVEPMLYDFLFDPISSPTQLTQNLLFNNFSSTNSVAFGFNHGRWKQNYSIGFNANLQKLTTELHLETASHTSFPSPDSLQNNLKWNRYEWLVRPSYSYMYNRLKVTIGLPIQYILLQTSDYFTANKGNSNRLIFGPSLSVLYTLSPYWEASGNASYRNNLGGINNAYTGYLMSSYRNLKRNEGRLQEQQSQNYGLSFSYRNPIYALFGNLSAIYYAIHSNLLFGINHTDILSIQTTYDVPNTYEGITLRGSISKGIDAISTTFTVSGSYTSSQASQINQDALVRYSNQQYAANGSMDTRIKRWASISYRFGYTQSQNKMGNNDTFFAPLHIYSQQAQFNLFPIKSLTINASWEYFYTSAFESGSRNMSFGNVNLRYKWPQVEMMLDYTNIFNANTYVSASYNNTSAYYYTYDLRPTEILLKVRFKIK